MAFAHSSSTARTASSSSGTTAQSSASCRSATGSRRDRDDRAARAVLRDLARRLAGGGRHDDRRHAQRLGDVAGGVADDVGDVARPEPASGRSWPRGRPGSARPRARSDHRLTASIGNEPTAVSPDSITAAVPSRIAFATSEASARVGSGRLIIDSSICVAVITGLPASRPSRMIRFCASGTPRGADLDAQVAARHHHPVGHLDDRVEVLDRLGLLDLGDHAGRSSRRPGSASSDPRRPRAGARRRAPRSRRRWSSANSRLSRSACVMAGIGRYVPRQVHALVGARPVPPISTLQCTRRSRASTTRSRTSPSLISTSSPRRRCGAPGRSGKPSSRSPACRVAAPRQRDVRRRSRA